MDVLMEQETTATPHQPQETTFLDIAVVLVKRRRFVMVFVFSVMVVAAVVSLLMPKSYEASAVITLPSNTSTPFDLLTGDLSIGASILGLGGSQPHSRYLAILNSRRLKETVIEKYGLISVYNVENMEKAIKVFDNHFNSTHDKLLGTIGISFEYEADPDKAAEITNFVVATLDEINRELATEQARSVRRFLQDRYRQARWDLHQLEDSLSAFQNKHGVIAIPEQTRAAIGAAADIQAQIIAMETELNVKKKSLGLNHPDLERLKSTIDELRKVERRMEYGGSDISLFIPFKQTPDLAMSYLRLFREIQIQTKIMEYLVPQYEQAKIQEAKDTPTLQVLDRAQAPVKHVSPKRTIFTLVAGVLGFMVAVAWVFYKEFRNKLLEEPEHARNRKWAFVLENLRLRNLLRKY